MNRLNGISMLPLLNLQLAALFTDASGNWGCEAQEWFQLKWSQMLAGAHISVKEATPIVLVTVIWGKYWRSKRVQIFSDNTAAVETINSHSSRLKESGHLLRSLAFLITYYQCELIAKYLPGKHNTLADALSCNNKSLFLSLHPQAQRTATPIPAELLHLLIIEQPDWTSHHWTGLWSATLTQV